MSETQYRQGMPAPPGLERFVRPEHFPRFSFITPEKKQQLSLHVLNLWNVMLKQPRESADYIKAGQQLSSITQQLQTQMTKQNQAMAQNQAQAQGAGAAGQSQAGQQGQAAAASAPSQQAVQQARAAQAQAVPQNAAAAATAAAAAATASRPQSTGAGKAGEAAAPAQPQQSFNWPRYKVELEEAINTFQAPPETEAQPDKLTEYITQMKTKARQYIQVIDNANAENAKLQKTVQDRAKTTALTDEDRQKVKAAMNNIKQRQNQSMQWLQHFMKRAKQAQEANASSSGATAPTTGATQVPGASAQTQIKKEPTETANNASAQATPTAAAPPQAPSATSQKPVANQTPTTSAPPVKPEPQRPPPAQTPVTQQPQQPQQPGSAPPALTHQAALERARNHPQAAGASAQTPTSSQSQQSSGGQPSHSQQQSRIGRSDSHTNPNFSHGSINKQLQVEPVKPVVMPSARPTLSGGAGGQAGVMSQPGLQKHPGFVLEGEGERVLSDKKLEELVRQVTGSAGGEGSDTLDPEVKETLLDLADEFVDNVITSACRVAKLRSSSTLELRDIQLILERNYNIRVPGYASDELRTVKKIQPSQAWAQKMSAVQAAKVTGGKTDI